MIRDPQNVNTVDPAYRDRSPDSTEGMGTGTLLGMMLGALLLAAGGIWAFSGPQPTTTATNPPPVTTGQGSPSMSPPPVTTGQGGASQTTHAPVPTTAPIAPSITPTAPSIDTNKGVDVEESPTMKK